MDALLDAIKPYGVGAIFAAFLLYRDFMREKTTASMHAKEREFTVELVAIVVSVIDNYEQNSTKLSTAINSNLVIGKAVLSFLRKFDTKVTPDSDEDLPHALSHVMDLNPSALKAKLNELLKQQKTKGKQHGT